MKLSWGWRIAILYSLFVLFMSTLVIASNHQHFDLVSKDYYEDEITYQKVIDAGKNQSNLSQSLVIHADGRSVTIDFPKEFDCNQWRNPKRCRKYCGERIRYSFNTSR